MAGNLVVGGILVVVVVDGLSPIGGLVSFEEWDERLALHVGGDFSSRHVEKGLRIVEVLDQVGVA